MKPSTDWDVRLLGPDDAAMVLNAGDLFDFAPISAQTSVFLASDRDFLWFACSGETPIGFVSASILLHPDKPPHLFVNELAVDEDHRRKGVATALMQTAISYAKGHGLWPVWVAAEADDFVAQAFYRSLNDATERGAVVFEWE